MFIANLSVAEALESLRTTEEGLSNDEAQRRLKEFGYNKLEEIKHQSILLRFFSEFTHFFAIILWVAAVLAFWAETQEPGEGMFPLGVAILGGYFNQWRFFLLAGISC